MVLKLIGMIRIKQPMNVKKKIKKWLTMQFQPISYHNVEPESSILNWIVIPNLIGKNVCKKVC